MSTTSRSTIRLTTAQALVTYLARQHVERDGVEQPFFAGCLGILGHGNLAGLGQALQQQGQLRFVPMRNEQAMVHAAAGYARMKNRLGTFACTASIGPGATNLVTGAAAATNNRNPVLLLPATSSRGATSRRCCSSWSGSTPRRSRSTTACARFPATGTASTVLIS